MKKKAKLTPMQSRFVSEFMKDSVATDAIIRAGYKGKNAAQRGSQMLELTRVKAEIQRRQNLIADRTNVTAEKVITEYALIAFSDITEFLEQNKGKRVFHVKSLDEIPKTIRRCISEISYTKDGGIKFKLHSKTQALEALSRHLGLFEKDNEQKDPFLRFLRNLPKGELHMLAAKIIKDEG